MLKFHSIFYKNNKSVWITFVIYISLSVLFAIALTIGSVNQYYFQCVVLEVFAVLMALRAAFFIFEKIKIDSDLKVLEFNLLKIKYEISNIVSIKKVRLGQLRLITIEGKQVPLSVDNEKLFILTMQQINPEITIE